MKYTLREWQQLKKPFHDLIVQASALDGSDSWQPWPIGMGYEFLSYGDFAKQTHTGPHTQTLLSCFLAGTDDARRRYGFNRRRLEHSLTLRGIYNLPFVRRHTYWKALLDHKFIISPEGNGIDCHRHYEALLAGCIPIVEDNPLIREKYAGCPMLYTKTYKEITEPYLQKVYTDMLDQTYDFSCLFLSTYSKEQQDQIKQAGNFWLQKKAHQVYYSLDASDTLSSSE